MSVPKIKEVQEALQAMTNDLVLVNDQVLNKATGNPVETEKHPTKGYQFIIYNDIRFLYHRVVFFLHSGLYPDVVDHIDGDKTNNNPSNLRAATFSQNAQTRNPVTSSKSGLKGVRYIPEKKKKPYRATIMFQGKTKHIGYFDTKENAMFAYDVYAKVCFGEFANCHNEELFYQRVGSKLEEIKEAFK